MFPGLLSKEKKRHSIVIYYIFQTLSSCRLFKFTLSSELPNSGQGEVAASSRAQRRRFSVMTERHNNYGLRFFEHAVSETTLPHDRARPGKVEWKEKAGTREGEQGYHRDGKRRMSQTAPACPARIRNSSRRPRTRRSYVVRAECTRSRRTRRKISRRRAHGVEAQ